MANPDFIYPWRDYRDPSGAMLGMTDALHRLDIDPQIVLIDETMCAFAAKLLLSYEKCTPNPIMKEEGDK
jgi:hypothetical protein